MKKEVMYVWREEREGKIIYLYYDIKIKDKDFKLFLWYKSFGAESWTY